MIAGTSVIPSNRAQTHTGCSEWLKGCQSAEYRDSRIECIFTLHLLSISVTSSGFLLTALSILTSLCTVLYILGANEEPRSTNTVSHRSLEVDWTSEPVQTSSPISLYCSSSAFVERGPKRNQMAYVWTVLYIRFQHILSQIK